MTVDYIINPEGPFLLHTSECIYTVYILYILIHSFVDYSNAQ